MLLNNLGKQFPELVDMPADLQEQIVEQARYQTFTAKGNNRKFAKRLVGYFLIGGVMSAVIVFALINLFEINSGLAITLVTGSITAFLFNHQQKSYRRQIYPKVRELAKQQVL